MKHYVKNSTSDKDSAKQFYDAFTTKWGTGPSYQTASCMAGLYHLEGAVKIAGVKDPAVLLTVMNDFSSPSFFGKIGVDRFGRNTLRSSILVDYDDKAVTQVVAPLFAAKEVQAEHVYPMPSAESNQRNFQCDKGKHVTGRNQFCMVTGTGNATTHGPYGEFCGTGCEDCKAGTHSFEKGSVVCTACPRNLFAVNASSTQCIRCETGQSTNGQTGAKGCATCPSGTFNDEPGQDCRPCPPGSYSLVKPGLAAGATACIKCKDLPGFFFQPEGSKDHCIKCPSNTVNSGSNGLSLNECVCKTGFWRPNGRSGMPCVAWSGRSAEDEVWEEVDGQYLLRACPPGSQLINTTDDGKLDVEAQRCRPCGVTTYIIDQIHGCMKCPKGAGNPSNLQLCPSILFLRKSRSIV